MTTNRYDGSRELRSTMCDGAALLVAEATGDDAARLAIIQQLAHNGDLPGALGLLHAVVVAGGQAVAKEIAHEATEALDDERPPRVPRSLEYLVALSRYSHQGDGS